MTSSDPAYGYRVKSADREGYVLGEWTVFWHHPNKKCFHEAGWVKDPPEDLTPAKKKPETPAAGSQDRPRDNYGSVTDTTTTVVPDPDDPKDKKIRTTVTTYSSGIKVITTEYLDKKGKVKKIVITTIAPGQEAVERRWATASARHSARPTRRRGTSRPGTRASWGGSAGMSCSPSRHG